MKTIISILILPLLLSSCSQNKIIYVADALANGQGVSPKKCLQIKENLEDEWTLFYDSIEGFDYQEGNSYTIEVNINKIKDQPKDSSSLKYKLVKIIKQEKRKVSQEEKTLQGEWQVTQVIGIDSLNMSPTLIIDINDNKISGNAGCNRYSAFFKTEGKQITIAKSLATKRYCQNMNIEDAFFECLKNTSYYKYDANVLSFYSKADEKLLACVKM